MFVTSLVLLHALNWDLSCLRCNFFDFVMQAKQAMQASLGIKVLGYSSFVQDCASLALLFIINAFAIESARTRDTLVMACPYAKSLHDEFPVSLAQDMSLLDNWPLLISFEHRAKRNKYTWNARCSYKMQEKQQDEILSLVVGTETGNKGVLSSLWFLVRRSIKHIKQSNLKTNSSQQVTNDILVTQWHCQWEALRPCASKQEPSKSQSFT